MKVHPGSPINKRLTKLQDEDKAIGNSINIKAYAGTYLDSIEFIDIKHPQPIIGVQEKAKVTVTPYESKHQDECHCVML